MFGIRPIDEKLFDAMHCKDGITRAKVLVEQGADIYNIDFEGRTALHHAARYGQVKNIAWLLNQGLDINYLDYNGKTPLAVAKLGGTIDFLMMKGGKY